jgi:hypothetical protein
VLTIPELLDRDSVLWFVLLRIGIAFAATYMLFTPHSRTWFARRPPRPVGCARQILVGTKPNPCSPFVRDGRTQADLSACKKHPEKVRGCHAALRMVRLRQA